jgi:hypothetical protein
VDVSKVGRGVGHGFHVLSKKWVREWGLGFLTWSYSNCGTTIWVVVAQMVYIGTTRPSLVVGYTVRRIQDDRSAM